MTAERNLDRQLNAWLEGEVSPLPEDLLDRSLARIGATRQRPGWIAGEGIRVPMRGMRPQYVPAWAVALLALAATGAVIAVGAQLLLVPNRTPLLDVSPAPTNQAQVTEAPTQPPPTPAGPLGGRLVLGYTENRTVAGSDDVILVDAGTGKRTKLGELPGPDGLRSAPSYGFQRGPAGGPLVLVNGEPTNITAAGGAFDFRANGDVLAKCCSASDSYSDPMLSPQGDRVAVLHSSGFDVPIELLVLDLSGKTVAPIPIPSSQTWFTFDAWAPDGSALLVVGCQPCNKAQTPQGKQTAHHGRLYLIPLDGSPWRALDDINNGQPMGWFLPDGSALITGIWHCAAGSFMPRCDPLEGTAEIGRIDLASEQASNIADMNRLGFLAVSPDGSRIAYATPDGIFVMDVGGGDPLRLGDWGSGPIQWSPDGQWLAYERFRAGTWIVPVDGSSPERQLGADVYGAAW